MRGTRSRRNFRSGRSGTETEIDFGPPAPEHREGQPGKWPVHFRQVLPTWRENEKKIKNLLKFNSFGFERNSRRLQFCKKIVPEKIER